MSVVDTKNKPGEEGTSGATDDTLLPEAEQGSGTSFLAQMKQKRQRIRDERHYDLDIPGYNGDLVSRHKPLDWEVMKQIGERASKMNHPKKELAGHADIIAQSCIGVFARNKGELVPFGEIIGQPDMTVRFDPTLANAFDFHARSAREVVYGIFNDELAITAAYGKLDEWMGDTDREDDELFNDDPFSRR